MITAAAAIMVTVFFSFVLGEDPNAKLVGLGLAVAVLVDATLVRMILVPATMELLGEANWYLPRWLDWILPKLKIEEEEEYEERLAHADVIPGAPGPEAELPPVAAAPAIPSYPTVQRTEAPAPPSRPVAGPGRIDLETLLQNLPFKAGLGDVRSNLEEVALATYEHYSTADISDHSSIDVSRVSGYLALEQRLGRIGRMSHPDHAAQLLMGALAAQALTSTGDDDGQHADYARNAVRMVLEGIAKRGQ